ncbi:hypothetical protein DM02DRAFT_709044 [Periconia macrospinosa]|uniref:Helix-turn-helix domain-containing protein n=1 Tax=Periconia macrospinosa TaxID=97972 RepID=A0A2V1DQT3_9PLEO|nr:hypothetical protein DM02DRAFT_709044 [Periconia macrospinosa]
MGSSASKSARAASSTIRKYPSRPPPAATRAPQPQSQPPLPHDPDVRDPLLAARLNTLGAVQPNPHYSPSSRSPLDPTPTTSTTLSSSSPSAHAHRPSNSHPSTHDSPDMPTSLPPSAFPNPANNPAVRLLSARSAIADEAEEELGQVGLKGFQGRKYIDASQVSLALMRRGRGEPDERIEEALGLKKGRLGVLGRKGVVEVIG